MHSHPKILDININPEIEYTKYFTLPEIPKNSL